MSSLNPWQRLAARLPSPFVSDAHFTPKKAGPQADPERERTLGISALSAKGKHAHLLRQATRRRLQCK